MTGPTSFSANVARRTWIAALCLFCVLVLAVQCWVTRFSINPDGISYLDMADQLLQGNLRALVHPYWSPLYSCLLALGLKVFSPGPANEILTVHLVNSFIGLMALASFAFFVGQWPRAHEPATDFRLRTGFAYSLFLLGTIEMIGLGYVSPDLCVAALGYLIAGLCCRLANPRAGWLTAAIRYPRAATQRSGET